MIRINILFCGVMLFFVVLGIVAGWVALTQLGD